MKSYIQKGGRVGPSQYDVSARVTMPFFTPRRRSGARLRRPAPMPRGTTSRPRSSRRRRAHPLTITHGTTVVAIRTAGGVVMAGDRRATSGNLISHRAMEKVFPADRCSGVAIAGAAGPAMEMVKLFQLQLEHYEKVEGHALSLEGKANQLGQMVRNHLPAAMQGMAVVPLFAGYDRGAGDGPAVRVRRHRRTVRGAPPRGHRFGLACTPAP